MHGLAALLVPDFHKSAWTDQEVGYALARNIPILPLKFGQDPYGFIGRFQALNCINLPPNQIAYEVAKLLISNPSSQNTMADAVARQLLQAGSFARAKLLVELLEMPASLPEATLDQLAKAKAENDQVPDAWGVPERIGNLFKKNGYKEPTQSSVDPKYAEGGFLL